jgi:hypothetical protein
LFVEWEKPALLLPAGRFPSFEEGRRSVHRDGHIEVAKAYYSVPPEYTARQVWVRWDGHLVRVFNIKMESIAVHVQVEPGTFQTQEQHIHSKKISQVEKGTVWLLQRIALLGTHAEQWARQMLEVRGIPGVRVLVGLLSLTHRHSGDQIDRACEIALTHGAVRLKTIRELLQGEGPIHDQDPHVVASSPLGSRRDCMGTVMEMQVPLPGADSMVRFPPRYSSLSRTLKRP